MSLVQTGIFRKWLLGLFVVAQVGAAFPLVCDQFYERASPVSHTHNHGAANTNKSDADHQHKGLPDFDGRCCEINFPSGYLPAAAFVKPEAGREVPLAPTALAAVVTWHPALLERPPKSLL